MGVLNKNGRHTHPCCTQHKSENKCRQINSVEPRLILYFSCGKTTPRRRSLPVVAIGKWRVCGYSKYSLAIAIHLPPPRGRGAAMVHISSGGAGAESASKSWKKIACTQGASSRLFCLRSDAPLLFAAPTGFSSMRDAAWFGLISVCDIHRLPKESLS